MGFSFKITRSCIEITDSTSIADKFNDLFANVEYAMQCFIPYTDRSPMFFCAGLSLKQGTPKHWKTGTRKTTKILILACGIIVGIIIA
jgi:hypothetical protein